MTLTAKSVFGLGALFAPREQRTKCGQCVGARVFGCGPQSVSSVYDPARAIHANNLSAREGALRSSGSRSTSINDSPSTAHLNGLQAPAMGGVHASLHD
jgi:hypothetical protein